MARGRVSEAEAQTRKAKRSLDRSGTDPAPEPPKPHDPDKLEEHRVDIQSETALEKSALGSKQAARQMYAYAKGEIDAGRAHILGSRTKRNARVKQLQKDMGRIKVDGVYGQETRQRGRKLLGKSFPIGEMPTMKD